MTIFRNLYLLLLFLSLSSKAQESNPSISNFIECPGAKGIIELIQAGNTSPTSRVRELDFWLNEVTTPYGESPIVAIKKNYPLVEKETMYQNERKFFNIQQSFSDPIISLIASTPIQEQRPDGLILYQCEYKSMFHMVNEPDIVKTHNLFIALNKICKVINDLREKKVGFECTETVNNNDVINDGGK